MFLANFSFVVSHLKIQRAVNLNTLKALTFCSQKEKFIKNLPAFFILMFQLLLKKQNGSRAPHCTNRADKILNIIILVTLIVML